MSALNIINSISIEGLLFISSIVLIFQVIILLVFLLARRLLIKDRFMRFLAVLIIQLASSFIPWGWYGLMFGFPAVLISSIFVTAFLDKKD
jgi:hypothetical protein